MNQDHNARLRPEVEWWALWRLRCAIRDHLVISHDVLVVTIGQIVSLQFLAMERFGNPDRVSKIESEPRSCTDEGTRPLRSCLES